MTVDTDKAVMISKLISYRKADGSTVAQICLPLASTPQNIKSLVSVAVKYASISALNRTMAESVGRLRYLSGDIKHTDSLSPGPCKRHETMIYRTNNSTAAVGHCYVEYVLY